MTESNQDEGSLPEPGTPVEANLDGSVESVPATPVPTTAVEAVLPPATDLGTAPPPPAPVVVPPAAPPAARRQLGKVRSPIGCWLLVLITFGIYGLFWYYLANRELRDYDNSIDVSPGLAVLALFVPIVGLFSVYNTGKRIRQAQTTAGLNASASGGLGVVLTFIFGLWTPYYISEANRVWTAGGATR